MKPIKRAIIACWVMLVACFAIKIFGGNWFEIVCTNEHFLKFCDWVDGNEIVRRILGITLYVPSTFFIIISISLYPKPNKSQAIFCLSSIIGVWCVSFFSNNIKSFAEILLFLISPIVFKAISEKKISLSIVKDRWYFGIVGLILVLAFQAISLITRNIGMVLTHDSFLITSFLMIDYYIMIALYYLYIRKNNLKE